MLYEYYILLLDFYLKFYYSFSQIWLKNKNLSNLMIHNDINSIVNCKIYYKTFNNILNKSVSLSYTWDIDESVMSWKKIVQIIFEIFVKSSNNKVLVFPFILFLKIWSLY